MKTILTSEYYTGTLDEEREVLILKRTSAPFKDPEAMLRSLDDVVGTAKKEGAEGWPLLADQIDAPAPTSERYRMMFIEMGKQMSQRFSCIAVLLGSQESVERVLQEAPARESVVFCSSREEAFAALEKMRQS